MLACIRQDAGDCPAPHCLRMSCAALFLHVSADAPDGDFTGGNRADGRSVVGLYQEFSEFIDPDSSPCKRGAGVENMNGPAPVHQACLVGVMQL